MSSRGGLSESGAANIRDYGSDSSDSDDDEEIILLGKSVQQRLDVVRGKRIEKVLVIIDLNGLFFDRVFMRGQSKHNLRKPSSDTDAVVLGSYLVHKRPGLGNFLDFLFANFSVMIWSSARMQNIQRLIDHAFGQRHFVAIWDQEKCTVRKPHPTNERKPCLFLKKLQDFWDTADAWDQTNTILIDDSPLKAIENPPHTSVHPEEWTRSMRNDVELNEGVGKIHNFFRTLRSDVIDAGSVSLEEYIASQTFLPANERLRR